MLAQRARKHRLANDNANASHMALQLLPDAQPVEAGVARFARPGMNESSAGRAPDVQAN
jgi:hypothetical protein